MYLISEVFLLLCLLIFLSEFQIGLTTDDSDDHKSSGGGNGGVIFISSGKKKIGHSKGQEVMMIPGNKGCSPTIIKEGDKKSTGMVIIGQCGGGGKKIKKEYIPFPMPVKEYVPIHMPEEKTKQPIIVQIKQPAQMMEMPMMHMPMKMDYGQMGMDSHMDFGMSMGMDRGMDKGMDSMHLPIMDMGFGHEMSGMDSNPLGIQIPVSNKRIKEGRLFETQIKPKTKLKKFVKTFKVSEKQ